MRKEPTVLVPASTFLRLARLFKELPKEEVDREELRELREQVKKLEALVVMRCDLDVPPQFSQGLQPHEVLEPVTAEHCQWFVAEIEKLRKERNAFQDQCIRLKNERAVENGQLAALAEQNEKQRAFLEFAWKDIPMNEYSFKILEDVMNLPNLAAPALNRIRAVGMRMAAQFIEDKYDFLGEEITVADEILAKADELSKGETR